MSASLRDGYGVSPIDLYLYLRTIYLKDILDLTQLLQSSLPQASRNDFLSIVSIVSLPCNGTTVLGKTDSDDLIGLKV